MHHYRRPTTRTTYSEKYITDIGSLELKATFSDALQAIDFLHLEKVDLIFLDVHLPKISGIDFLKTLANPPAVILTTAFSDYALESYEFNVMDYLLKPFSFQRFVKAIAKVSRKEIAQEAQTPTNEVRTEVFIKSGHEHLKVNVRDIIYIKSDTDYTEIHTEQKRYLSSETLRYWLENLGASGFERVHKSYIVNTGEIEKIAGNRLFLSQKITVPIGRVYKDAFIERFVR